MKNKNHLPALAMAIIFILFIGCKKEESGAKINYGTVKDNDGVAVKTVIIGTQTWMAEDLKTVTFRNGDMIPAVGDQLLWNSQTTAAYCEYNTYDQKNPVGRIYNWYTTVDSRQICPEGWHVASNQDWEKLSQEVGPAAAPKLKEASINYWAEWTNMNTNETGFTAKPNCGRSEYPGYNSQPSRRSAGWWSSTSENSTEAWIYSLTINDAQILSHPVKKIYGVSIRCVKD